MPADWVYRRIMTQVEIGGRRVSRRPPRRARGLVPQADGQRADAGVLMVGRREGLFDRRHLVRAKAGDQQAASQKGGGIMTRNSVWRPILIATLVCGTLDILFAVILTLLRGKDPAAS